MGEDNGEDTGSKGRETFPPI